MNLYNNLPSAKAMISTAASVAATLMMVRSFASDFIPHELRHYIVTKFQHLMTTFTNEITLVIHEFDGLNKNNLFSAAELYLNSVITNPSARSFRASLSVKEKKIYVSITGNEDVVDKFRGFELKWRMFTEKTQAMPYADYGFPPVLQQTETRHLELTFHKKHKIKVIEEYLPHVVERSKAVTEETKTLKLHTLSNDSDEIGRGPWRAVNFDHPSNFETLAMDDEIKNMIIGDLDRFLRRREFYRTVGKAWKRGYLLFGPPGTGKSSLIAAMANYLKFDVYDLELTSIRCNSQLRRLLISTANRSILVVEDIDASLDLSHNRKAAAAAAYDPYNQFGSPKVTLSGLLNFIDGLWSSCGDERIIVFTTNHKEMLDPALLRPGRMDVHIDMTYLTPRGFKLLLTNYLGSTEHVGPLVLKAEELIASTKVTPAEVGEYLLKSDDPGLALQGLISFLEMSNIKCPAGNDVGEGLKEFVKCFGSVEMMEKMAKNDDFLNAYKVLVEFLVGDAKDSEILE